MSKSGSTINGCRVLEEGRSPDGRTVVLCELPVPREGFAEGADRYVVWYLDHERTSSTAYYDEIYDAVLGEFESRTYS